VSVVRVFASRVLHDRTNEKKIFFPHAHDRPRIQGSRVGLGPIPEFVSKEECWFVATERRNLRQNVAHGSNLRPRQDVFDEERMKPVGPPERLLSLLTRQVFLFDM
jgi:hypothetical protein